MKALALFSGGLDSLLAIKLITEQNIEVIALYFDTGFGDTNKEAKVTHLKKMAKQVGARLEIVDIQEQFVREILFDPKYGYGKNFNPCIDCHANMFAHAKKLLDHFGASFLISGEVVGQRPMSQRQDALAKVGRLSEAEGLIVRPLSAKLLEPSIPELEGWIDREKLLDIHGRGRERQLKLAQEYGITDYETPSGGCLLTDERFSMKIRDFIRHDTFEPSDIPVLKVGRHLRLPEGAKLVIGRNKEENDLIEKIDNPKFLLLRIMEAVGPLSLLSKNATPADTMLAARLVLTYAKTEKGRSYRVAIGSETVVSQPLDSKEEAQCHFAKA